MMNMEGHNGCKYKVAIVILNWNGYEMLKTYLPSVIEHSKINDCAVVVIDNNSSDNSLALLESEYPMVDVVRLDKNYGFAGGYNHGLKSIDAYYYVLLNSDVRVSDKWLEPIIDFMDKNLGVAACQPKLRSDREPERFEYAGAAGGFIDKYGYPFCRGRVFECVERDCGQYDDVTEIFWASGAALFVRTEMFWEVGGFDETFFAHMEEIDLCWRLKNRGYSIFCIPDSVVYHLGAATLKKENPFKTYLNFRNNLYMLHKNLPDKSLNRVLFARFLLDYLSVIVFVVSLKFKSALAVVKARKDFKKNKFLYVRKLKDNEVMRWPVFNFSIVFRYYVSDCNTFKKLLGK